MSDTEKMLAGAVGVLFTALATLGGFYRRLGSKKDVEIRAMMRRLEESAEAHRLTVIRIEGDKDKVERELRDLYERMLDAAYKVARGGGHARPHRGDVETVEDRRIRLATVTGRFTRDEMDEYARTLAPEITPLPGPLPRGVPPRPDPTIDLG